MSASPETSGQGPAGPASPPSFPDEQSCSRMSRFPLLRRLWPEGTGPRLAILLLMALLLVQAGSLLWYLHDRAEATLRLFGFSVGRRVGATVELLEQADQEQRAQLIQAITSPSLIVTWNAERPAGVRLFNPDARAEELEEFVHEHRFARILLHEAPALSDRPMALRFLQDIQNRGWGLPPEDIWLTALGERRPMPPPPGKRDEFHPMPGTAGIPFMSGDGPGARSTRDQLWKDAPPGLPEGHPDFGPGRPPWMRDPQRITPEGVVGPTGPQKPDFISPFPVGFRPGPPPPDLFPSRRKLVIGVELKDGSWVNFVAASDRTSLSWAWNAFKWTVASLGLLVIFAFWAGWRASRPLRHLTDAAERLGLDFNAAPLPETGSREIRKAAAAFNRMQGRLQRFVEDRTMMLAAISHDLRTMLTRLRLRAEFIDDDDMRQKAMADLDDMNAMLSATLAFARGDAAQENRQKLDLAAMLQDLFHDQEDLGREASYQGPERLIFTARPVSLKRALENLVENAIKYGGCADLALLPEEGQITITIGDRGPGISEDMREQVFAPFFRVDRARTLNSPGSLSAGHSEAALAGGVSTGVGLGLATARSILHSHGGDITLSDRPGGGLLVTVTLPGKAEMPARKGAEG